MPGVIPRDRGEMQQGVEGGSALARPADPLDGGDRGRRSPRESADPPPVVVRAATGPATRAQIVGFGVHLLKEAESDLVRSGATSRLRGQQEKIDPRRRSGGQFGGATEGAKCQRGVACGKACTADTRQFSGEVVVGARGEVSPPPHCPGRFAIVSTKARRIVERRGVQPRRLPRSAPADAGGLCGSESVRATQPSSPARASSPAVCRRSLWLLPSSSRRSNRTQTLRRAHQDVTGRGARRTAPRRRVRDGA